jgi:hypothetical protein
MAHDPLACGDLIAERRFAYAKAAADDGDWSAAAEIFDQALERAPHSAKRAKSSAPPMAPPMHSVRRWQPTLPTPKERPRGLRSLGEAKRRASCRRPMSRGCSTIMRQGSTRI